MKGLVLSRILPTLVLGALAGPVAAAPVTIQFIYPDWGDALYDKWWGIMAKDFEAANPDIQVELLNGGGLQKLTAMAAGGVVPDTFWVDMQDAEGVYKLGIAADLNRNIAQDPSFAVNEIIPQALDIYRWGGQLVALPHGVFPNNYYFNADMFEASGLVLPSDLWKQDQWTWSAFSDAARKLTSVDAGGRVTRLGANAGLWRAWVWSNGVDVWDDIHAPTRSKLDSPAAVEALQYLQDRMWQDGSVWGGKNNLSGSSTDAFLAGKLGMEARWSTGLPYYQAANFKFGAVPYPKGPQGAYASDFATWGFGVSKGSKHPQAAWKWVAFLTGRAGNLVEPRLDASVPARIRYTRNLGWLPNNMINPESVIELLEIGKVRLLGRTGVWSSVNPEIDKLMKNQEPAATATHNIAQVAAAWLAQNQ